VSAVASLGRRRVEALPLASVRRLRQRKTINGAPRKTSLAITDRPVLDIAITKGYGASGDGGGT